MPLDTWRNSGRNTIDPNSTTPAKQPTALVTATTGLANRSSGSSGSRVRRSTSTKPATASTAAAARPRMRDEHHERGHADRQVHVEDPAPGEMVDEEPAEQRPGHRGQRQHAADVADVPPP